MRKLTFSLLLVAATFIVKSSNAQSRGNLSDWRIPPPYTPSSPTATLPWVKLPHVKQPDNPALPGDMEPDAPAMPVLPKAKFPVVLPPLKSPWTTAPTHGTLIPGAPTTPGEWSSERLGGGEPYWWHPGIPGDPSAPGPGFYDNNSGGWIGSFTGTSVGPLYWHVPSSVPPVGVPSGPGHFSPVAPPTGGVPYFFHPGIPGNPYARGPGYYDHLDGGTLGDMMGTNYGPFYWVPEALSPSNQVKPPVQPQPAPMPITPGLTYTPESIIATSVLLF